MIEYLKELFIGYGLSERLSVFLSYTIAVLMVTALCVITMVVIKKLLLRMLRVYIAKSKNKWDDIFLKNKVFERLPAYYLQLSSMSRLCFSGELKSGSSVLPLLILFLRY